MRGQSGLASTLLLLAALPVSAQQMPHMMHEPPAPAPKAAPAPAESGLSLADMEGLALQRNPTLAQAAAQIQASRGKAVQAGLWCNPTVGYVGDQMGAQGTAGELQGGFIQQVIVTGGKLRLSRAKYRQEAYEAELLSMAQEMRVANAVRLRFFEVLADQQHLEIRRLMLGNAEESFKTHREMLNAGQAGKADVLMAEVEVGRARVAQRTIENMYLADWQALVSVIGAPELKQTHLSGSLESSGAPLEFESSLCRLLEESPQVQAARAHVVHDQIMVRRERVQPVPDVTIQANTGHNYETNNTVAALQVGIALPVFDRNQGTIQQARADLSRSNAEVTRLELQLRQRLAEVFAQYQTARQTAELYREVNVPRAQEALEVQEEMYRQRRLPWPRVVSMRRDVLTIRLEYIQSLLEQRRAETQIVGFLLTDGLMEAQGPMPGGHIDSVPKPR
jgi:cobalt-zinc-cadmium efflux system outer membrane protein